MAPNVTGSNPSNESKRKIIIDCDPGVDDAYAIQFLLNCSHVELLAILT